MSKGFDQLERASLPTTRTGDFARVSENDVNVCKQISSLLALIIQQIVTLSKFSKFSALTIVFLAF